MDSIILPKRTPAWANQKGHYKFCYPQETEYRTRDQFSVKVLPWMGDSHRAAVYIAKHDTIIWIKKETLNDISRQALKSK